MMLPDAFDDKSGLGVFFQHFLVVDEIPEAVFPVAVYDDAEHIEYGVAVSVEISCFLIGLSFIK